MMLSRSHRDHVNISYYVHVQPFAKEYFGLCMWHSSTGYWVGNVKVWCEFR